MIMARTNQDGVHAYPVCLKALVYWLDYSVLIFPLFGYDRVPASRWGFTYLSGLVYARFLERWYVLGIQYYAY